MKAEICDIVVSFIFPELKDPDLLVIINHSRSICSGPNWVELRYDDREEFNVHIDEDTAYMEEMGEILENCHKVKLKFGESG